MQQAHLAPQALHATLVFLLFKGAHLHAQRAAVHNAVFECLCSGSVRRS